MRDSELLIPLAGVIFLAALQVGMASIAVLRQAGAEWVLSSRDKAFVPIGLAGRLTRAHRNLLEVLPQFVASVLLVHIANSVSALSVFGIWTFLVARILLRSGVHKCNSVVTSCLLAGRV